MVSTIRYYRPTYINADFWATRSHRKRRNRTTHNGVICAPIARSSRQSMRSQHRMASIIRNVHIRTLETYRNISQPQPSFAHILVRPRKMWQRYDACIIFCAVFATEKPHQASETETRTHAATSLPQNHTSQPHWRNIRAYCFISVRNARTAWGLH